MEPTDYQGNAKKQKEQKAKEPKKRVESVVSQDVIVKKRSLGRKVKDVFIEADFKGVVRHVISDVLIPAAKNMIVEASIEGVQRAVYRNSSNNRFRPGIGGSRFSYQTPVNRGMGGSPLKNAPPVQIGPRSMSYNRDEIILSSKQDADKVLEHMNLIIDQIDVVTVADLNDLIGVPQSYVDNKWGWDNLTGVQILQGREGWLLDLPPAQPL